MQLSRHSLDATEVGILLTLISRTLNNGPAWVRTLRPSSILLLQAYSAHDALPLQTSSSGGDFSLVGWESFDSEALKYH